MLSLSAGTHNTHDGDAELLGFADVLVLTEADLPQVRAWAKENRYDVHVARHPLVWRARTIIILTRKGLLRDASARFHRAHRGRKGISPARGTLKVKGRLVADGSKFAVLGGHRVNGTWDEDMDHLALRRRWWQKHYDLDQKLGLRLRSHGYRYVIAGDPNTKPTLDPDKPRHLAYDPTEVVEEGNRLDRIGFSRPVEVVRHAEYLGRGGSDHPRVRAVGRWKTA